MTRRHPPRASLIGCTRAIIWFTLDCGCQLGFDRWISSLFDHPDQGLLLCPVHDRYADITDHHWVTDTDGLIARPCRCCGLDRTPPRMLWRVAI